MPSNDSQVLPINTFMSYRRADNDVYGGVVDRLKIDLAGRFEAETGRGLKVFVDRDDIGWGDDWRRKILDSIRRATFFIPVITMRYFESEMCREEFTAFYEDARRVGVTGLIRPIVLAGGDRVAEDSENEHMRIVAKLNYVSIEEEFDEGFDSPMWRKKIKLMVGELAKGIEEAEDILELRESTSAERFSGVDQSTEEDEEVADLQALQSRVEDVDASMKAAQEGLNSVVEALDPVLDASFWDEPKNKQRIMVLAAAQAVRGPATSFAQSSSKFESDAVALESGIRLAIDEIGSMESDEARRLAESLSNATAPTTGYQDVLAQLDTIEDGIRLLGMLNINMRKASQPVLRGMKSFKRAAEALGSLERFGNASRVDED